MLAVMPDKFVIIQLLGGAVERLHSCEAVHAKTVSVFEAFQGQMLWEGDVEVFDLVGHRRAKRCYAWVHQPLGQEPQCVALLDIWPVVSAGAAVKASIAMDIPLGPEGRHWIGIESSESH